LLFAPSLPTLLVLGDQKVIDLATAAAILTNDKNSFREAHIHVK
jgi:hypothetical protein